MMTSPLPVATAVQAASFDPTVAAGRPLIRTDPTPDTIAAVWIGHFRPPGLRCGMDLSPTRAAPRPLMITSPEPLAITYGLQ